MTHLRYMQPFTSRRLLILTFVALLGLSLFACSAETKDSGNTATTDISATFATTDTAITGTTGTMSTETTDTSVTTSTTTPSTTSTAFTLTPEEQQIDNEFKAMNPGKMLINAPQTMRVGVAERFVLRIASAGQSAGMADDLPASGQSTTSVLHVTPKIHATLAGNGFTIQNTSPEEQVIGGGSFTEWSWNVIPTESGDRELVVSIQVVLKEGVKAIPKRWPVHVSPNARRSASLFFAKNWQWLSSTLLIPLLLFFWRQRKKQT